MFPFFFCIFEKEKAEFISLILLEMKELNFFNIKFLLKIKKILEIGKKNLTLQV